MSVYQLPRDRRRRAPRRGVTVPFDFQDTPFYRAAIDLSAHFLFCAGYADDALTPLADALGQASFRLARVAGEAIPGSPPASLMRAEEALRSEVGLLDLCREMEAVPADLDRATRRLAGQCLEILAQMKASLGRRALDTLGRRMDERAVGKEG